MRFRKRVKLKPSLQEAIQLLCGYYNRLDRAAVSVCLCYVNSLFAIPTIVYYGTMSHLWLLFLYKSDIFVVVTFSMNFVDNRRSHRRNEQRNGTHIS